MRVPFVLLAVSFAISSLAAQSVSASLSALTPLSVQVQDGAMVLQDSQPIGPLGSLGELTVQLPAPGNSSGLLRWDLQENATARVVCGLSGETPTSQVRSGPQEFLVQFTATSAAPAAIQILRQSSVTSGVAWPGVQIDFDNNGTIDLPDVPEGFSYSPVTLTLGAQPVFVRVILDAALQGVGQSFTTLHLAVVPENHLHINKVALSCGAPLLNVYPVFGDRGIDASLFHLPTPMVYAVGLRSQPVLLPSVGGLPCLLVPSLDIVAFSTGDLHVSLPATLRPITFWLQGAVVVGSQILTTDAYRIDAF